MLKYIYNYFAQYTKRDWEILALLLLVIALVFFLPIVWFYDYTTTYEGVRDMRYYIEILTKSLRITP